MNAYTYETQQRYAQEVRPYSQQPSFEGYANTFVEGLRQHLLADSKHNFNALDERRQAAKESDDNIRDSLAYKPVEARPPYYARMCDTGYAGDEKFVEQSKKSNRKLRAVLDTLPVLKACADAENITFSDIRHLRRGCGDNGFSAHQSGLIAIDTDYLHTGSDKQIARLLKEEILYHMDKELGFSKREDFRNAARILFANQNTMLQLHDYGEHIHERKKATLRMLQEHRYSEDLMCAELLVEYFHIRDDTREKAGWVPSRQNPSIDERVDADMEKIFGATMHQLCKQFDTMIAEYPQQAAVRVRPH